MSNRSTIKKGECIEKITQGGDTIWEIHESEKTDEVIITFRLKKKYLELFDAKAESLKCLTIDLFMDAIKKSANNCKKYIV